jgi:hypothetical protein
MIFEKDALASYTILGTSENSAFFIAVAVYRITRISHQFRVVVREK